MTGSGLNCLHCVLFMLLVCLSHVLSVEPCPHRCRCDRLNTVDCSGLALTELPSTSRWPQGVTRLLLQKNHIRILPSGAFGDLALRNLTTIDLSDNILDDIQARAFVGLSNIVLLDLQRNRLKTIKANAFTGLGGQGTRSKTRCRVDLRHNDLENIRDNAFAWTKDLSLVFGESKASLTVRPYAFYGMRSVESISISGVKELTILPRTFTNVEQLDRLEVSNLHMTAIHNFTFEGLTEFGGLHINNCTIKQVEPYAFAGVKYIKNGTTFLGDETSGTLQGGYIVLSNCTFPALPQDVFRDTNIVSVTLSGNTLDRIEAHAFRDTENLRIIKMNNNSLTQLSTNSLAAVKNLKEIIIHSNKISTIEAYAFKDSGNIETISIGQSTGTELTLHSYAFSQLFEVGTLQIANLSKLTIMPNAFKDVIKVDKLIIENVSLPTLERNSFNGLRLVGSFHISFCNVTTIRPGVFGKGSTSRSAIDNFDMSKGNRIECGCDIRRVLSEFQSTFTTYSSVQCVRVSESGSLIPVPIHQVPVCGSSLPSGSVLLLLSIPIIHLWTREV